MAKVILEVCSGTSCHLMGSFDLWQVIKQLKVDHGNDLKFSIVTCLGQCGNGPNVRINGKVLTKVTPEQLKKHINQALVKWGDGDEQQ